MTEQNKQKIANTIKALLAKAAGSEFEGEAAIFAAKAQELMAKHQVEVTDILADDPIDRDVPYSATSSSPSYKKHLWTSLARYYGCRTVISWKGNVNYEIHVIGRESSHVTAALMYPFIMEQVRKAGRKIAQETGHKPEAMIRDVANALVFRLNKLIAEQDANKPAPATTTGKNALIVTDAVNALMEKLYPNLKSTPGRAIGTNAKAVTAAQGISLSQQMSGEDRKRLR